MKEQPRGAMNQQEILETIPHKYPFLLIDGILEREGTDYAIGFKNVCFNDPYLYREPNRKPRLPETLITECMSQVGAVAILSFPEFHGKIMLFAAIEDLKFYKPVYPGDQLVTRVERVYLKSGIGKMKAVASVNQEPVAEGFLSFALAENVPQREHSR